MTRTLCLLVVSCVLSADLSAQAPAALTPADSQLVHRILAAEDARDASAAALREGEAHADARLRTLAARARARITDSAFAARESLVGATSAPAWPEPDWQPRFRALARKTPCADLVRAFSDDSWHVRLRAVLRSAAVSCVNVTGAPIIVTPSEAKRRSVAASNCPNAPAADGVRS